MAITPNYLYPLQSDRQLQWTKQAVKGENTVKKPFRPKSFSAPKKEALRVIVKKSKLPAFGKPQKTRSIANPMREARLPMNPMRSPDPVSGVGHIANVKPGYNGGYQP